MTLRELTRILPGYTVLYIHAEDKGVRISAGEISSHPDLSGAIIKEAIPLTAYSMEVTIESQDK